MLYSVVHRCLLLIIIIVKCHVPYIKGAWPISSSSSVQLLGLFRDEIDAVNSTKSSIHSRAMFKAAIILSQKYNIKINDEYIDGQTAQTGSTSIGAFGSACLMLSKFNILGIVGPALSREAHVMAQYSETIGIPLISYSATDPDLSNRNLYPTFYRTVPSDDSAAISIVHLFQRFSWTSCIVIYQNDQFGSSMAETIGNEFVKNNLTITNKIVFDITTLDIQGDLQDTLTSSPTRIAVLWSESIYIPRILKYALDANVLGPDFTWILSSSISFESFNETSYSHLIGLLSIESIPGNIINAPINTTLLNEAYKIWRQYEPETFPVSNDVNYKALFAFDATWTLIQSLQQNCFQYKNSSSLCGPMTNISFCFDRRFPKNNSLLNIIDSMRFLGVSGFIQFSKNTTDRIDGINYLVKNVRSFVDGPDFVPILKWSHTDHWKEYSQDNVIIWPGNSLKVPNSYVGLSGVRVRICYIESEPFLMQSYTEENKTKFIGYMSDVVDNLQDKLHFIPQIQLLPRNQSYYQCVQAVANGICDMFIADVTVTAKRREIVDFSSSIFDNSLSILVRKTNSASADLFAYLKPFSTGLWLTILATTVYGGILICFLERRENEAFENRSLLSTLVLSVWFSVGTVVGYGADFHVQTAAGRMLTIGLYFLSLILVASYTANLASYLTTLKQKEFISGLDDIKNKKIRSDRIGLVRGSSIEEFYLREISEGIPNYYPLRSTGDIAKYLLDDNIDAAIWDTPFLQYITNNVCCDLTIAGPDFGKSSFGIAVPKQWIYKKDLDVAILSLKETGILDGLGRKWFLGGTCPGSGTEEKPVAKLDVISLSGLLVTFAVISGFALILFAWTQRFRIKDFLGSLLHNKEHSINKHITGENIPNETITRGMLSAPKNSSHTTFF